jgi:hypothetical protein
MIIYDDEPKPLTIEQYAAVDRRITQWKRGPDLRPVDTPLGPPKKKFDETFSALDALFDEWKLK